MHFLSKLRDISPSTKREAVPLPPCQSYFEASSVQSLSAECILGAGLGLRHGPQDSVFALDRPDPGRFTATPPPITLNPICFLMAPTLMFLAPTRP